VVECSDILSHKPDVIENQVESHEKRDKKKHGNDYQDNARWLIDMKTVVKSEIGINNCIFSEILN